mgnify:FL=1
MDTASLIALLKESLFLVVVFGAFFVYAMAKGRYALINIIFGLYIALLISRTFPYYNSLSSGALTKVLVFIVFVIAGAILMRRHIPGDDYEPAFQSFGKKFILATLATILVMTFSFHAFPGAEIVHPGTPIQALFAPPEYFFWWLVLPLLALFFL